MIFKGSRYSTTAVVTATGADGKARRAIAIRTAPPAPAAFEHVVSDGDRLDRLAARYYGEATKYWLILDGNPGSLNPFELLVPGQPLQIPSNRIVTE